MMPDTNAVADVNQLPAVAYCWLMPGAAVSYWLLLAAGTDATHAGFFPCGAQHRV